jgi:hypothetical protein
MAKKRTSGRPKSIDGPSTADPPFAVPDWPATTPKLLPLREIIPYERNPRTHPPEQIALLAKLMLRHGVDQPIVVDEANVVLKGHGRLLAAQEAGFETFPVVTHRGLSAAEKTALRIEDNQLALISGWDRGLLREEMMELKAAGYDMPLLGFDEATLGWMVDGDIVLDPSGEWGGMPGFHQEDQTAFRSIVVHFKNQKAVDDFAGALKQTISERARYLWYPVLEIVPQMTYVSGGKNGPRAAIPDLHSVEGKTPIASDEQGTGKDAGRVPRGRGRAGTRRLRGGDRPGKAARPR